MARLPHIVCVAAIAAALLGGCQRGPRPVEWARPYPLALTPGETLNIHVIREGARITLTNTTPRAFGPSMLWLNNRFGRPLEGLAVGETVSLHLGGFADENSDRFKPGGFFATEKADLLAVAELETTSPYTGEQELLRLIAVGNRTGED